MPAVSVIKIITRIMENSETVHMLIDNILIVQIHYNVCMYILPPTMMLDRAPLSRVGLFVGIISRLIVLVCWLNGDDNTWRWTTSNCTYASAVRW